MVVIQTPRQPPPRPPSRSKSHLLHQRPTPSRVHAPSKFRRHSFQFHAPFFPVHSHVQHALSKPQRTSPLTKLRPNNHWPSPSQPRHRRPTPPSPAQSRPQNFRNRFHECSDLSTADDSQTCASLCTTVDFSRRRNRFHCNRRRVFTRANLHDLSGHDFSHAANATYTLGFSR